VFTSQKVTMW